MTPEEFIREGPKNPEELIGKAQSVARLFCAKAKSGIVDPVRLLCYGPPGIGKSATCKLVAHALADHPASISHVSAKQVTVDHVRGWMSEMSYAPIDWRVFWIEEVDAVNPDVEVLLLQFIDQMRFKTAALFTSNEQMSGISGRFQSRMQSIRFDKPSVGDVERFLMSRWPELGDVAHEIAELNNGDIRASLNDAQLHLDVEKYVT